MSEANPDDQPAENLIDLAESEATGEAPASEAPTSEAPTSEAPASETEAQETLAEETPAEETPAEETPAAETLAAETLAAETLAAETPAPETPAPEIPETLETYYFDNKPFKPYSFVLVDVFGKRVEVKENVFAFSPSFHVLLDHLIAVLWIIFSPEDSDVALGSGQISWALKFLEGVKKNSKCEHYCEDIKMAIKYLKRAFVSCVLHETTNPPNSGLLTSDQDQKSHEYLIDGPIKSILLKEMLTK